VLRCSTPIRVPMNRASRRQCSDSVWSERPAQSVRHLPALSLPEHPIGHCPVRADLSLLGKRTRQSLVPARRHRRGSLLSTTVPATHLTGTGPPPTMVWPVLGIIPFLAKNATLLNAYV